MITVKRLTLEDARIILEAAEVRAKAIGVAETICVCDDGGHPIALHRMTGARITGVEIAMAKAFTAAGHRRATHKFNASPSGPALPEPVAAAKCAADAAAAAPAPHRVRSAG